jgi:hypothetical protein
MALLVLRSIAVYAGTAALAVWLVHRFVVPMRRRVALVLAMAPLLFTGRAMWTGGVYGGIDILYEAMPFGAHRVELAIGKVRTPSLSDVVYIIVPWMAATRRAFSEGRFPLWNPGVLAGDPLLAMQQPAVLHPGVWIGMLLPLPQAWTFLLTLRLLLALLCAYAFLRDLGCRDRPALIGAAGWAFSDFLVFFLGWAHSGAAAPFPLLLLGARRLVRAPGRRSVGILVAGLLLVVSAGHPETFFHGAVAAGLYFLFELRHAARGARMSPVRLGVVAAALALGLSAATLLPLLEALPQTVEHADRKAWYATLKRSVPGPESIARLAPQVVPYSVGVAGEGRVMDGFVEPSAYAGLLLFPLALVGLFSRARARWFFLGLGLFCLSVCVKTPTADLLTKLPLFDIALNERLVFLVAFSVCALAALGADRLYDGEGRAAFLVGAGISVAAAAAIFAGSRARMLGLDMPPAYMRERLLLQLAPVLAGAAAIVLLRGRWRAGLSALLVIFVAQRVLEAGRLNPTVPARAFYPRLSILDPIPRGTPDRMTALAFAFIPNASAVYGLEDVRGYEAMTLRSIREVCPLWSELQGVWYNRVDDPTRPFLSFLNVRWILTPLDAPVPAGWPVVAEADGLRLIENPHALARAFVPKLVRNEPDAGRRMQALSAIVDFGERGVIAEAGPPGDWKANGDARVSISSYGAQMLDLEVDARTDALVATSIPAWSGWRASVDGERTAAVSYNHAFLAYRVPRGVHRLALCYAPDGFRFGLLVSLASLLLLVGWGVAARSKRPKV